MENSFVMLGQYKKQAKRAGISQTRIDEVLKDATSDDREHLEEVLFEGLAEIDELLENASNEATKRFN